VRTGDHAEEGGEDYRFPSNICGVFFRSLAVADAETGDLVRCPECIAAEKAAEGTVK